MNPAPHHRHHGPHTSSRLARLAFVIAVAIGAFARRASSSQGGPNASLEPDGDHGAAEVSVTWQNAASGAVFSASQLLLADLANHSDNTLSGDLLVVCSGLDGRLVERPLGSFHLAAGAHRRVKIPIGSLPIQSEESTAFVTVQAQIHRADGTIVGVPAAPIYYHFRKGYREAVFYSGHDVATTLKGGIMTSDPARVVGRVRELDGRWTNVVAGSVLPLSPANASRPQVGLSTRAIATAVPDGSNARGSSTESTAAETSDVQKTSACCVGATVRICATWRVQFIDSGLGEDVFATSSWQDVPAKFANVILWAESSFFWEGQLDLDGCATRSLPYGNYTLEQRTTSVYSGGIGFDIYYMSNGSRYVYSLYSNFSSPGSGNLNVTLHHTFNNDAVQAAAVMGQIAAADVFNGGMGVTPGWYTILTNQGCGALDPKTDSCYNPSDDTVHIGTTAVGGGTPESHWKYIIAHEVGHNVQWRAMGFYGFNYDDTATESLCKCDHYTTRWGNKVHCIQSREQVGGAMLEGFGQAFASRTFNFTQLPRATFVYYKPFLPNLGVNPLNPPRAFDAFNSQRWMENHCTSSGRGVEYDWMGFFYNVASSSSANNTTFSNLFDIYKRACTGSTITKCGNQDVQWNAMDSNARAYYGAQDARYLRFRSTGINYGVAH